VIGVNAILSCFLNFVKIDILFGKKIGFGENIIGKNTIILFEHSGVNAREVPNHSYRAVAMDNRSALDIVLLCLSDNGYTISSLISDVLMRRYTLLNHNPSTTL